MADVSQIGTVPCEDAEAFFEQLPCMALVECEGRVIACNALARRWTGVGRESRGLEELLLGAYDFSAQERRYRFNCVLLRSEGAPVQVSAAAQAWRWRGEACRLVVLIERGEGFAGASESDGGFVEDVLDAIPEATVVAHEGRVLHVNEGFTRLFGYGAADCRGELLDRLVLPGGLPGGGCRKEELSELSMEKQAQGSFETVRRTRLGERVSVCVASRPVRLGGDARGVFITYRDIRGQKRYEARLEHAALHDGLTGLANRALFHNRVSLTMARLQRQPERNFAVVFLDLDGFKQVNDRFGHAVGDGLLQTMAERLKGCLRPQDTVARFGGDEFALLVDETAGPEEIGGVLERVQIEVGRPIDLGGSEARLSASMGVALGSTEYANSDEMLRDADVAMYQAKARGKGRQVLFGAGMSTACVGAGAAGAV